MSSADEQKPKEDMSSKAEEVKEQVADELESEMEGRDEARLESERAEQEDLNQGFSTGTHDTTRHGVDWGPSYTIRSKAAAASQGPKKDEEKDPNSKP